MAGYRLKMEYAGKLLAMTFILVVIGADGRAGERLALLTGCSCVLGSCRSHTPAALYQARLQVKHYKANHSGRSLCLPQDWHQVGNLGHLMDPSCGIGSG